MIAWQLKQIYTCILFVPVIVNRISFSKLLLHSCPMPITSPLVKDIWTMMLWSGGSKKRLEVGYDDW
jgi:hypothetical protein